jgi:hypothetical protein
MWTASTGKMNIGIRHILPAFPFLFLLAGYVLHYRLKRWALIVVGTLAALNAVATWRFTTTLMYFNFPRRWTANRLANFRSPVTITASDADLQRWLQTRRINKLAYLPDGWGGVVLSRANIQYTAPPCEDTGNWWRFMWKGW